MFPTAVDAVVLLDIVQPGNGEVHQVVSLGGHPVILGEFRVETAEDVEIVGVGEREGIIRIQVGGEIVLAVPVVVDAAHAGFDASHAVVPVVVVRLVVDVVGDHGHVFLVVALRESPHVAFQVDVPVLHRLEDQGELVGVVVVLRGAVAAVLQGFGLHAAEQVSVRVIDRDIHPAAGDVVHEQTAALGQVGRTGIVLATPLGRVVHPDPVGELGADFRVDVETVHPVLSELEEAVGILVGAADPVVEPVRSAADADVVVMRGNVAAIEDLEPVGAGVSQFVGAPHSVVLRDGAGRDDPGRVVLDTLDDVRAERKGLSVVQGGAVPVFVEMDGIHHLGQMDRAVEDDVSGVGDMGLAGLAALGVDEDDAEGAPGTVDRGGSGVLQDGDTLDVVGIDRVHVALDAVDQHERGGGGAVTDGTGTADVEAHVLVELATPVGDAEIEAGDLSLQGLGDRLHRAGLEHVGIDHAHGAGDIDLFLDAVTDDDGLFQGEPVLLEGYVDGTAVPGDVQRQVADGGNLEDVPCPDRGEGEVPVYVRGRALEGAFDENGRADDGFPRGVDDRSLGRLGNLCPDDEGSQGDGDGRQDGFTKCFEHNG